MKRRSLRYPLGLLLCLAHTAGWAQALPLTAESADPVYRRGWQLSLHLGPGKLTTRKFTPFATLREPRLQDLADHGQLDGRAIATEIMGGDTVTYYEFREGARYLEPRDGNRLNLALRAHRRRENGIEYSGGIYYSRATVDATPADFSTFPEDVRLIAFEEKTWQLGVITGIRLHVMRNHRAQPFVGLDTRLLYASFQGTNFRRVFSRNGLSLPAENSTDIQRQSVFRAEIAFPFGVNYALSYRLMVGLESSLLRDYAHLVVRYRLTNY